jgi:aminopeptidase-like protein
MHRLIERLFPICRSITGNGVRETLRILGEFLPLTVHEVPTGTAAFDWTVPREWNIRDAWIKNPRGEKIVDFAKSNLHVLNYSVPVHKTVSLAELKGHLFSLPGQPDLIPYRTSYYQEAWGFCLPHHQLLALEEGEYEVMIDATLADGSLTYGECLLPGATTEEVLLSCHVCHPSLANDNLAGMAVAVQLARWLAARDNRYAYRLVFIPGTIGAITWLSRNEANLSRIRHGLVLTLLGDPGHVTYKKSRRGEAEVDRAVQYVLGTREQPHKVIDFFPYGYDERQYCSPGINLPVGCLMRTPHGQYPEYHTSADNLALVQPEALADSLAVLQQVLTVLEQNVRYLNKFPKGEPQLGRRGLYGLIGGNHDSQAMQMAMLWVLNLADGEHTLLDMTTRSGVPFGLLHRTAALLLQTGLVEAT